MAASEAAAPSDIPWREREFLKINDAAAIAGVSPASLYNFEKQGRLEFRRFAGRTQVVAASLVALLEQAEPWTPSERGSASRAARKERAKRSWGAHE